jgi:hypothetical protein
VPNAGTCAGALLHDSVNSAAFPQWMRARSLLDNESMRTRFACRSFLYALGFTALACGGDTDGSRGSGRGTGGSAGSSGGSGGGGAGGGGAGGGGTGGSGGGEPDLSCANPRPVVGIDGAETGFVDCEAGFLHRPERRVCPSIVPRPDPVAEPADGSVGCTRDQECGDLLHGHCIVTVSGYPAPQTSTRCVPGCVRDEDCGAGFVCMCGDPVGHCSQAACSTDAECGDGLLCTSIRLFGACGDTYRGEFGCQEETDTCRGTGDCEPTQNCAPTPSGRACTDSGAGACGGR